MTTRIAAPAIIAVSLAVLMSGCAGATAASGGVHDDLRPVENSAAIGLARGHVIVRDDLSPNRVHDRITDLSVEDAILDARPRWTVEARRELHASSADRAAQPLTSTPARGLMSGDPVEVDDDASPLGGSR
jgi:hypothetical protein